MVTNGFMIVIIVNMIINYYTINFTRQTYTKMWEPMVSGGAEIGKNSSMAGNHPTMV